MTKNEQIRVLRALEEMFASEAWKAFCEVYLDAIVGSSADVVLAVSADPNRQFEMHHAIGAMKAMNELRQRVAANRAALSRLESEPDGAATPGGAGAEAPAGSKRKRKRESF